MLNITPSAGPAVVALVLCTAALPAAAQEQIGSCASEDHVVLHRTLQDRQTGVPVRGATLRVTWRTPDGTMTVAADTDSTGKVQVCVPASYDLAVRITHPGYTEVNTTLGVLAHDPDTTVRLTAEAITLAPVAVRAFSQRLDQVGYYERENRGIGTFISRRDIDVARAQFASDLLRNVPGVRLATTQAMRDAPRNFTLGRGTCRFRFLVNGTRMLADFELDHLPPQSIEGIEIYAGLAQVPALFRAQAADATGGTCGVIAVWTRVSR